MKFAIAEKPSVAMELAKAIGGAIERHDGYILVSGIYISWAYGHLVENAKPDEYDVRYIKWSIDDLPFFPDPWISRPRSEKDGFGRDKKNKDGSILLDAGIVKQLKVIGNLLKKATCVVNAGDSAREGQLIIDEILDFHHYKGYAERLWLQEMNLPAIKKAWLSMKPNSEYRNLYLSAIGRSSLDFLMGMNLTRGYTIACKSVGHDMVVHIGRVQTPTTCIVVARDLEIESFIAKDYFTLKIRAEHANGTFMASWVPKEDAVYLDAEGRVTNKAVVDGVAQKVVNQVAMVTSYVTTPKTVHPPLPFSLGDLQKAAFKQLGLSATDTLNLAQALYEKHKLLSYPRTDYAYLPEGDHAYGKEIIEAAKENLGAMWDFPGTPDFTLVSPAWNDKKIGDHFAIRPTNRSGYDIDLLSPLELKIYKMVVKQFLAQFYAPYKYDSTVAELECVEEKFKGSGQVEKQVGWKILYRNDSAIKEKKDDEQIIPKMNSGDDCLVKEANVESKKTSPPPRFDTASLIEAMEKAYLYVTDEKVKKVIRETGIGTPATRSNIIDSAVKREYFQEISEGKKKFFVSTEKARFLYKLVPEWLRKPDLTAYFEEMLKQVESGEIPFEKLVERLRLFIEKQINAVKNGDVAKNMPEPGSYAAPKRVGRKGTRTKTVGKVGAGGSGRSSVGECPVCKSALLVRNGSNGPFVGCSGYPNCKHTEQVKPTMKSTSGSQESGSSSNDGMKPASKKIVRKSSTRKS
jgi:DNA topoisomerase III